ncbi:MAG: GIY-YIG nuclease family protein [Alphaproteobacteria bacterium]|nr:GIY-YIG nuclease family protein [Alphaproteobacteria bacterium]
MDEPKPISRELISRQPGAYLLFVDLAAPLALDIPRLAAPTLVPGCYAYCGSAHGPGGLRARIGRHLRRDKAPHWHIDRLTAAGRVTGVRAVPAGRECDLLRDLLDKPGVSVPVPGFGSSDCRACPAHLVMLPAHGGFESIPALACA